MWKIFFFKFCGLLRVSKLYCKTLAQPTPSYWKTEKNSSFKCKQSVTGKENSNLLYGENIYKRVSSTEPTLMQGIQEFKSNEPFFKLPDKLLAIQHNPFMFCPQTKGSFDLFFCMFFEFLASMWKLLSDVGKTFFGINRFDKHTVYSVPMVTVSLIHAANSLPYAAGNLH